MADGREPACCMVGQQECQECRWALCAETSRTVACMGSEHAVGEEEGKLVRGSEQREA